MLILLILSPHARLEMTRRRIPFDLLERVLQHPEQIVSEKRGRKGYQSRVDFGDGKILLRAIVEGAVDPANVIDHGVSHWQDC